MVDSERVGKKENALDGNGLWSQVVEIAIAILPDRVELGFNHNFTAELLTGVGNLARSSVTYVSCGGLTARASPAARRDCDGDADAT